MKMLGIVKELQDNSTGVEVEESDSEEEEWTHNEEEYLVDPRTGEVHNGEVALYQRVGTSFKIYAVGHRVWKDGRWTLERNE